MQTKRPAPQGERAGRHQLGSDDPAYTGSRPAPQQRQPPDPISILRPGDTAEVREARRRLHRAQAWCAGKAADCKSSFGTDLALLGGDAASFYVFANASAEALNEVADLLLQLLVLVDKFEGLGGGA